MRPFLKHLTGRTKGGENTSCEERRGGNMCQGHLPSSSNGSLHSRDIKPPSDMRYHSQLLFKSYKNTEQAHINYSSSERSTACQSWQQVTEGCIVHMGAECPWTELAKIFQVYHLQVCQWAAQMVCSWGAQSLCL